jgi:hypothetical protein
VFGLIFLAEIPWLAALIGVSLDHVPVLNSMYLSDSFIDQPRRGRPASRCPRWSPSRPVRRLARHEQLVALAAPPPNG